jgi:hypothetical protein
VQENKNSHTYTTSSQRWKLLPLLSIIGSLIEKYCSLIGRATLGSIAKSKAPLKILGANYLAACFPNNENISLFLVGGMGKKMNLNQ